jgi:hypothetical protein
MSFSNLEPLPGILLLLAVGAAAAATVGLYALGLIDLRGFSLPLLMMPAGLLLYERTQARERKQAGADEA